MYFGWVFFLISSGSPHVRCTPVGRTCGEPDEIESTAMGVKLNGSRRVRDHVSPVAPLDRKVVLRPRGACSRKRAVIFFGWVFFLISPARIHVRPMGRTCGGSNEIELFTIGAKLNGSGRVPLNVTTSFAYTVRLGNPLGEPATTPCVPEPFNSTPMGVNSISFGSPHVCSMGRTCGEPNEIKKNTPPKNIAALVRDAYRTTRPSQSRALAA